MSTMDPHELSREERVIAPYHHIDAGFINYRLCFSSLGPKFHKMFEENRKGPDDHLTQFYNNHLIVDLALGYCKVNEIQTLSTVLIDPHVGEVFCSTEHSLGAGENVYKENIRVHSEISLPYDYPKKVMLNFNTQHFVADTGKLEMDGRSDVALIGFIRKIDDSNVTLWPLIIGAPSFDHPENKDIGVDPAALGWGGFDYYQLVPEDIDEFAGLESVEDPTPQEWMETMGSLPESFVKNSICELLHEEPKKDWGGESNDLFTPNIHVDGKRKTAAFVLKGPSKFSEMRVIHLGTNGDQIVRLANSPAQVLVVQHCHTVGEDVRAMLRTLAVQPSNPRHYCILDGKDTYRLLKANNKI